MKKLIIFFCIIACIFSVNLDAAVDYLVKHAKKKSVHLCAGYVAAALIHGGFKFQKQSAAYKYRDNGILLKIGYKEISKQKTYKKGDITITERNKAHKYGHMAMWSGKKWISDFVQNSEFVYSKSTQPPVHYYTYVGK